MLPKINRLTKNKEFDCVFKKGRSNYNNLLGIKNAPNDLGLVRLGILISNKVSKKAVDRNKTKRQVREIFNQYLNKIIAGNDFLIIALPAIKAKTYQEIEGAIIFSLKKLNVFKK